MSSTIIKHDFSGVATMLPSRRKPRRPRAVEALHGAAGWLRERLPWVRPAPPLLLEFADRFVSFRGMKEFEFALASRTEFPAPRVRDLMARSPAELEQAAASIREAERNFASVLARSVHEPALIGEFLRELELKLFSQDHGWREIMEALVRLSPEFDAYKQVALIKYMQYLRARQTIMRSVFLEKTRGDGEACVQATRALEDSTVFAHGDTAIFDLGARAAAQDDPAFLALPKGETVRIELGDSRETELLLAGNRLRLYTGRESYMVDDGDNTYPLHPGKNLVGRHAGCDVVVDGSCRAVSRNHLIVEPVSAHQVLLTDLSSHGTEVPAHLLKKSR